MQSLPGTQGLSMICSNASVRLRGTGHGRSDRGVVSVYVRPSRVGHGLVLSRGRTAEHREVPEGEQR